MCTFLDLAATFTHNRSTDLSGHIVHSGRGLSQGRNDMTKRKKHMVQLTPVRRGGTKVPVEELRDKLSEQARVSFFAEGIAVSQNDWDTVQREARRRRTRLARARCNGTAEVKAKANVTKGTPEKGATKTECSE